MTGRAGNDWMLSFDAAVWTLKGSRRTCTERGNTWWGSGGSRRLSSLWSRWPSSDTETRAEKLIGPRVKAWFGPGHVTSLTSHICSWNSRRSFSISSAISPPLNSVRIIPCCRACSLFSFSIFALRRSETLQTLVFIVPPQTKHCSQSNWVLLLKYNHFHFMLLYTSLHLWQH